MDTVKDLGLKEGEWEKMSEEEKQKMAEDWANDHLQIWFEEDESK